MAQMSDQASTEEFMRLVLEKLAQFNEDLSDYTAKESLFSSEVANELKKMKTVLDTTMTKLQKDYDKMNGTTDPMIELLTLHNLKASLNIIDELKFFKTQILSIEPNPTDQLQILHEHLFPIYLSELPALLSDTPTQETTSTSSSEQQQIFIKASSSPKGQTRHIDQHTYVNCNIHLPGDQTIFKQYRVDDTVQDILLDLLEKVGSGTLLENDNDLNHFRPDNVAFKVVGLNEYIYGPYQLKNFLSVREHVHKQLHLNLQFVACLHNTLKSNQYLKRILTFWNGLRDDYYKRSSYIIPPNDQFNDVIATIETDLNNDYYYDDIGRDRIDGNTPFQQPQSEDDMGRIAMASTHLITNSLNKIDSGSLQQSSLSQQQQPIGRGGRSRFEQTEIDTFNQYDRNRGRSVSRTPMVGDTAHLFSQPATSFEPRMGINNISEGDNETSNEQRMTIGRISRGRGGRRGSNDDSTDDYYYSNQNSTTTSGGQVIGLGGLPTNIGSDYRLRGISVAPQTRNNYSTIDFRRLQNQQPQNNNNDDGDDNEPVLRSLNQCKPIDFYGNGQTNNNTNINNDYAEEVRVAKLANSTVVNYEMEDDDRLSKRASGIIDIPKGFLVNTYGSLTSSPDGGRLTRTLTNSTSGSSVGLGSFQNLRSSQTMKQQQQSQHDSDDDFSAPTINSGIPSAFNTTNNTQQPTSQFGQQQTKSPFTTQPISQPDYKLSLDKVNSFPSQPTSMNSIDTSEPGVTITGPVIAITTTNTLRRTNRRGSVSGHRDLPPAMIIDEGSEHTHSGPPSQFNSQADSNKLISPRHQPNTPMGSTSAHTFNSTNNTANTPKNQNSTEVGTTDFHTEVKIQRDIQQRRRRSIAVKEPDLELNDSDEEDLGYKPRSRGVSTSSRTSQGRMNPLNNGLTLNLEHNANNLLLVDRNESRSTGDEFTHVKGAETPTNNYYTDTRRSPSRLADLNANKYPFGTELLTPKSNLVTTTTTQQQKENNISNADSIPISTTSSTYTSPSVSTMNRRASVATPSKHSLFKFSTLTQDDKEQLTLLQNGTNFHSTLGANQLGTFCEYDDGCSHEFEGKLFVPQLSQTILTQNNEDDVLFKLDPNNDSLSFDQITKYHRLMNSQLIAQYSITTSNGITPNNAASVIGGTPMNNLGLVCGYPSAYITQSNIITNNLPFNDINQNQMNISSLPSQNDPTITTTSNTIEVIDQFDHSIIKAGTPLDSQHLPPFQVHIKGCDYISTATCPRYGNFSEKSKLSIITCILSNNMLQRASLSQSNYVELSSAPRWEQSILPHPNPTNEPSLLPFKISELQRHAKICFILVESVPVETGKTNDINKHIPLAYCSIPIFTEHDSLVQGRQYLKLWPIANADNDLLEFGASRHLIDVYNKNGGKLPPPKEEKKKSKKDDKKIPSLQDKPGFTSVINDFDIRVCTYLYRGTTGSNFVQDEAPVLTVDFGTFNQPIVSTADSLNIGIDQPYNISRYPPMQDNTQVKDLTKERKHIYDLISVADALFQPTEQEKEIVWLVRDTIRTDHPHLLPLFLQSVNWANPHHRNEALRTLEKWPPPKSMPQVIALLDQPFTDHRVRLYAVRWLEKLSQLDLSNLQLFLLQLTQCLKFEPYYDSHLARFLLNRAIHYPYQIGHYFYWNLKNEMACDTPFVPRYRALLEAFLTFCPSATDSLRTQQHIVDECSRLATKIRGLKNEGVPLSEYMQIYQNGLKSLNRDYFNRLPGGKFNIPLDPRWQATTLNPDKCRIMSSKMVPLWLTFENDDQKGKPFFVMFKAGDDLRQDQLCLQILRFFDKIWLEDGLDLRLSPYNVVATGTTGEGKGCGMIQIVLNSTTTSAIHSDYGGGASGAFKEDTIWQFLLKHNKEQDQIDKAVDNFVRSCAGYCVATYILGIGDRHNGNIMVTNDGHFFHIDFGHFLGNFKSKYGLNRERSKFVFTKEMAYAMGGSSKISSSKHPYKKFEEYCLRAIDLVRQHSHELETLFITMISAGMPELIAAQDILYIREMLALNKGPQATRDLFKDELKTALNCTSRTWDNFIHNLKHAGK